jgi:hypothetical protein
LQLETVALVRKIGSKALGLRSEIAVEDFAARKQTFAVAGLVAQLPHDGLIAAQALEKRPLSNRCRPLLCCKCFGRAAGNSGKNVPLGYKSDLVVRVCSDNERQ